MDRFCNAYVSVQNEVDISKQYEFSIGQGR